MAQQNDREMREIPNLDERPSASQDLDSGPHEDRQDAEDDKEEAHRF